MEQEISIAYIKTALAQSIESQKETEKQVKETGIQLKETDKQVKETSLQVRETEQQVKETSIQLKETDKKVKEAIDLFTTQWGRLMESLVNGEVVKLFNEKGIAVLRTSTRMKGKYEGVDYEFDIIAHNGDEIVVIEVKTTLRVKDVKKHLVRLKNIKTWMSEYKNHKIIGAVAYLQANAESEVYAESKGLYVIRATGDSASIINKTNFEPIVF